MPSLCDSHQAHMCVQLAPVRRGEDENSVQRLPIRRDGNRVSPAVGWDAEAGKGLPTRRFALWPATLKTNRNVKQLKHLLGYQWAHLGLFIRSRPEKHWTLQEAWPHCLRQQEADQIGLNRLNIDFKKIDFNRLNKLCFYFGEKPKQNKNEAWTRSTYFVSSLKAQHVRFSLISELKFSFLHCRCVKRSTIVLKSVCE